MSADRNVETDLAGEDGPSSSEGLRPDTRTSNNEVWEGRPARSGVLEPLTTLTGHFGIPGLEQKIQQLEKETAQPERREAARARKKLIKDVQRNLSEAGTDADKVKYLENVFSEQITQQARLENQLIPLRRQCDSAVRERDAAVDEKARVVELNSKLHELCRELRKENALLLDTSKAISAQELSQRKSLTENFQETVEGITRRLEEHEKDRLRVVTENDILKQKLKALCDQYEARDSHFNQQLQTKDLELKMVGIRLQEQAELVHTAELQSKKMSEAFGQMQSHKLETDKLLESYNERFSECQHSIEKSNEVFKMLRQDGERKAQQLKQADKDKRSMNKQHQDVLARLQQANSRLVQLMDENSILKKSDTTDKTRLKSQNEKLQSLCRVLQQEVKALKVATPSSTAVDGASCSLVDQSSGKPYPDADTILSKEGLGDQNVRDVSFSSSRSADLSEVMSPVPVLVEASSTVDDGSVASLTA